MDILFEQKIIQNPGLGAELLWYAISEAYTSSSKTKGVAFPLFFLILPLLFHRRTAISLASKNKPGAIYKALAENREIPVGLQARMMAMADKSLQSLSLAIESGMLKLDLDNKCEIFPVIKKMPVKHATENLKTMQAAAKRVGQSFSELTEIQILSHLEVRF